MRITAKAIAPAPVAAKIIADSLPVSGDFLSSFFEAVSLVPALTVDVFALTVKSAVAVPVAETIEIVCLPGDKVSR